MIHLNLALPGGPHLHRRKGAPVPITPVQQVLEFSRVSPISVHVPLGLNSSSELKFSPMEGQSRKEKYNSTLSKVLATPFMSQSLYGQYSCIYLERAMATHSSALAWIILWLEEPGRLQSMGSLRVGHLLSDFPFTFHCHALEKEMATHSNVLAWRIPGMAEPGGLPSMGLHRVGHD